MIKKLGKRNISIIFFFLGLCFMTVSHLNHHIKVVKAIKSLMENDDNCIVKLETKVFGLGQNI